ncbi:MAG TPA: hypothetical protein VGD91_25705 [Trebonia sp.]
MVEIFRGVAASTAERRAPRPGDDIVADGRVVVMDRAFTVGRPPEDVWPWLLQLGKARAGWYLPRAVERFLPAGRRALRHTDARWLEVKAGDVVPDYGGKHATFTVAAITAPASLVYWSQRGQTAFTWSITLQPVAGGSGSRVFLRLRMAPVRHRLLARTAGEFFDALTIAGMAAGLRERLAGRGTGRRAN